MPSVMALRRFSLVSGGLVAALGLVYWLVGYWAVRALISALAGLDGDYSFGRRGIRIRWCLPRVPNSCGLKHEVAALGFTPPGHYHRVGGGLVRVLGSVSLPIAFETFSIVQPPAPQG